MLMKKKYCIKRNKYRKFKTLKIFFTFSIKILVISIICGDCSSNDEKISEEESIEILKFAV